MLMMYKTGKPYWLTSSCSYLRLQHSFNSAIAHKDILRCKRHQADEDNTDYDVMLTYANDDGNNMCECMYDESNAGN